MTVGESLTSVGNIGSDDHVTTAVANQCYLAVELFKNARRSADQLPELLEHLRALKSADDAYAAKLLDELRLSVRALNGVLGGMMLRGTVIDAPRENSFDIPNQHTVIGNGLAHDGFGLYDIETGVPIVD